MGEEEGLPQPAVAVMKKRGSSGETWTEWIERHKTILSIALSLLSLLIMVAVILFISRERPERDVTEQELERFAAQLTPKSKPTMEWDQIAGLKETKQSLQEAAVWPLLKPQLFTGLRKAHRGILLYGPPGTGKTLLIKALAAATKSTFMVVNVSDIANKYVGESEKRMRMLFKAAALKAPTIIFMDEIEALTANRGSRDSSGTMDCVLTEFLTGVNGLTSDPRKNILVIGATNTPDLLDEAVIRRLPRRIKVPLPDLESREQQIKLEVENGKMRLSAEEYWQIAKDTEGYSGSDLTALAQEAAMVGLRDAFEKVGANIHLVEPNHVRSVTKADFDVARTRVTPSVSELSLKRIQQWEKMRNARDKLKDKTDPAIPPNPNPPATSFNTPQGGNNAPTN